MPPSFSSASLDAVMHGGLVGDIEQDGEGAARRELLEFGFVRLFADRAGDFAAFFEDEFREGAAEAAGNARDEPVHRKLPY